MSAIAVTLFKVLVGGMSCHGGTMAWSLPTADGPGEWHEVPHVNMYREGLYLTSQPAVWWKEGAALYEVEAEGVVGLLESEKVVAKRVRLIRRLSEGEYFAAWGIRTLRGSPSLGSGDGSGYGSGYGYGSGSGSGYGAGYGYGYGYGYGDGWYGYGYGSGSGYGDGAGAGYGAGYGGLDIVVAGDPDAKAA